MRRLHGDRRRRRESRTPRPHGAGPALRATSAGRIPAPGAGPLPSGQSTRQHQANRFPAGIDAARPRRARSPTRRPPGGAGRPGPRRPRAFRWCPATLPINAKSPPPFAGKRALCIYDSQAFSARNFSSGSISMLSSGMGSDFMRLRPRNSLAAMAAKISAKPLIILTVIASL